MWRSKDDSVVAERLARVTGLPPSDDDPESYPWEESFRAARPALPARGLAAFDPGRRGVKVLLAVAAVVVCVSAAIVYMARPQVAEAPMVAGSGSGRSSVGSPGGASPSAVELVVTVTGKVHRPGLVRLRPGARVADAVEGAGGVLPGVDMTGVNLARKVVDGEMIAIGVTPPPGSGGGPAGAATAAGPINLNTASPAELQTLPGIGEVLAQRIVEFREAHGGFRAVGDLRQVEGIGDAKYQQLKDRVTV